MRPLHLSVLAILIFASTGFCTDKLLFAYTYSVAGASFPKREVFRWGFNKSFHLSPAGARQHYILGRELRQRYVDENQLLDEKYNPSQIHVQTPMIERATESVFAQILGLYPLGTGHVIKSDAVRAKALPPNYADYSLWLQDLGISALNYTYQSLPIVIKGGVPDTFLDPEHACPGIFDLELSKSRDTSWERKYKEELNSIATAVKVNPLDIHNISVASEYRDVIVASLYQGFPTPNEEEAHKILKESIEFERCAKYDYILNLKNGPGQVMKTMATPILTDVKKKLEDAYNHDVNNKTKNNELKYVMLVGTENLLAALIKQIGINEDRKLILPSSILIFELYKKESENHGPENYYVRYIYNDEIDEVTSLSNFTDIIQKNVYSEEDFAMYCKTYETEKEPWDWSTILTVLGVIVGVLVLLLIVYTIKVKCQASEEETEADEERILASIRKEYEA